MKKTDNSSLEAKLLLRRYFLDKYHAKKKPKVLDCCQGDQLLWTKLRKEYDLASYWGVDMKPKRGRLKIDSRRILALPGWKENVIDIDTYGSPWRHWMAMLPNVSQPITVFLTIGRMTMGADKASLKALNLENIKLPAGIALKVGLGHLALSRLLTAGYDLGIIPEEAVEAVTSKHLNARYVGVRLKKTTAGKSGRKALCET